MSKASMVCPECGWYEHRLSSSKCYPRCGAAVDALFKQATEQQTSNITTTKLGYGADNFVFQTDNHFHIQMEVASLDLYRLRGVWLLDSLTPADVLDLVKTLAAWRQRQLDRGNGHECICDSGPLNHSADCVALNAERIERIKNER